MTHDGRLNVTKSRGVTCARSFSLRAAMRHTPVKTVFSTPSRTAYPVTSAHSVCQLYQISVCHFRRVSRAVDSRTCSQNRSAIQRSPRKWRSSLSAARSRSCNPHRWYRPQTRMTRFMGAGSGRGWRRRCTRAATAPAPPHRPCIRSVHCVSCRVHFARAAQCVCCSK